MASKPEDSGNDQVNAKQGGGTATAEFVRPVRYGAMRVLGEFSARPSLKLNCGQKVVVETDRGIELGEPVGVCGCDRKMPKERVDEYVKNSGPEFCKPRSGRILRAATDQDVNEHEHLNAHINDDVKHCAALADQLGLDIRVVTAEHLLGGEQIVFYFSAPTRIDFRQLVRELAHHYHTRIVMRQVGARDEARLVADYEVCGRECCCKSFLKKLRPVTMKMAKLQKSTLDPSKVSGRCGRLRCCLRYEQEGYEELERTLPRVGARVLTELGGGTVVDRQILTHLLMVQMDDDDRLVAIPNEELLDGLPPDRRLERPERGAGVRLPQAPQGRSGGRPPPGRRPDARSERDTETSAPPPSAESTPPPPSAPTGEAHGPAPEGEVERARRPRRRRRHGPGDGDSPSRGGAPHREDTMPPEHSAETGPPASGSEAESGSGQEQRRRKRRRGRRQRPRSDGPGERGPAPDAS